MFSGKTLELIRRLQLAAEQGETVAAGKPALELEPDRLVSLAGPSWPASVLDGRDAVGRLVADATVVGVDEVQFLGSEGLRLLERAAADGVRVIAAGLDLDYRGAPFAAPLELAEHATTITRLTATCARCGAEATRSQRLVGGVPAPASGPTILLERAAYEPRCASCHEVH